MCVKKIKEELRRKNRQINKTMKKKSKEGRKKEGIDERKD